MTLFAIVVSLSAQLDLAAMAADECDFDRALALSARGPADVTDPEFDGLRRAFPVELAALVKRAPGRCQTW